MNFYNKKSLSFVPDNATFDLALERTTHLAIVSHQDDTEILAYNGIAECFNKENKWFTSVVVTNGSGSPRAGIYENISDEEMQDIRGKEQNKAAFIGEYSAQIQLKYPSADVKKNNQQAVINDLIKIIKATKPTIIYLHNPADKHITHVATTALAIKAIKTLHQEYKPKKVYGCEVWRSLDWLQDDEKITLPVSQYDNMSSALISVFDSQISGGKRYDLAMKGRNLANATFYASHSTDNCNAYTYAMDLTPLINDNNLTLKEYVLNTIDNFKNDVATNLDNVCPSL